MTATNSLLNYQTRERSTIKLKTNCVCLEGDSIFYNFGNQTRNLPKKSQIRRPLWYENRQI